MLRRKEKNKVIVCSVKIKIMMFRLDMISILEYPLGEPVTSYPGN